LTYNFGTTYTRLNSQLFQRVNKPDFADPKILLANLPLIRKLGIHYSPDQNPAELLGANCPDRPFAQAYSGHQFGYFTNLGDGRAMILGEHITPENERFDIQLKGSGKTRYSRNGDGKATASSMLREYLYSYAMSRLGINTSQSLAVLSTNQKVYRKTISEGAVLIRVMKSHIRFGTFEYVSGYCAKDVLKEFADYVIERHYPQLQDRENKYVKFFQAVIAETIAMVVDWYRVGFVHGVMNTDNMSITGETFDYGPCAFMNRYDPSTTYSEIDRHGRYSFRNQKAVLQWNLGVFGITLLPLLDPNMTRAETVIKREIEAFDSRFTTKYMEMMKRKLGITGPGSHEELIRHVLMVLGENRIDYTNAFVELMDPGSCNEKAYGSKDFLEIRGEIQKAGSDPEVMRKTNPQRILRNHLIEEALNEYENNGNLDKVEGLLKALSMPYEKNDELAAYQQPPAEEYDKTYTTHCNT